MIDKDDCERLAEMEADRAEGREISEPDLAFAEAHLAECRSCRTEHEALAVLGGDGNAGPLKALDDVARRRFVDGVLAAAAAGAGSGPGHARGGRRALLTAAAVLATAAAVVAAIAVGTGPKTVGPAEVAPAPGLLEPARVLLAYGDARVSGARARVGEAVGPGTRLAAGSGEIWVGLPTGFSVSLFPDTRITVRRLDREALVLAFEGGRLLVSAIPGRQGPRLTVETREGDVTVKGTVLSIDDRSGPVEVLVARGLVEVRGGRGGGRFEIGSSEAVTLDGRLPRASLPEEDEDLLDRAAAFDILDTASETSVDLRSVPSGAVVEVDGARLGTTPLVAAVRAGHRRLEVALAGHPPVREILSLAPGSAVTRYFDLQAVLGDAGAGVVDEPLSGSRTTAKQARPATAQELLIVAQDRRALRDFAGAATAYEELLRLHPSSDEARAAMVSLGQIKVDRLGDPGSALRHFDAYLGAGGKAPLRIEALLGRARSLRALGRVGEERETLKRFLAEYPGAIQALAVRKRLDEIRDADSQDSRGP